MIFVRSGAKKKKKILLFEQTERFITQ